MTEQEYQERDHELLRRQRQVERQRDELKREFIGQLALNQGDMLEIDGKEVGWFASIDRFSHDIWEVRYNPPKKDGTRSNRVQVATTRLDDVQIIRQHG